MTPPSGGADREPVSPGLGRWVCPACGLALRPDDSISVVRLRPFHTTCAEASFVDRAAWEHTDALTLSQWARGIAWRSAD